MKIPHPSDSMIADMELFVNNPTEETREYIRQKNHGHWGTENVGCDDISCEDCLFDRGNTGLCRRTALRNDTFSPLHVFLAAIIERLAYAYEGPTSDKEE
jgi:hypothetical protein